MEKKNFFEKIDKCFMEKLSMKCSDDKKEKLFAFMNMLIETNKVMNLTAIVDEDLIIMKHFVDSLEVLRLGYIGNEHEDGQKVVDIGTGAGFPGLPLAIMCENVKFLLLDSLQKRIRFLNDVIDKLGLENVKAVHLRAEDAGRDIQYREKFDVAVSRGVSKINVLAEYLLPFVKVGGKMVLYKMDNCEEEVKNGEKAVKLLGGKFSSKITYELLNDEPKRCLLVYDKKVISQVKHHKSKNREK